MSASGEQLRDAGIQQAVDHANAVHPRWIDQATDALRTYIQVHPHTKLHPFTSENVRDFAEKLGLPEPPHLRAWGGVFQRAAKDGLIEKVGIAQSQAAHCHCSFVSQWLAV